MTTQLWENQLRRGSFNGVAFSTLASDSISGRRTEIKDIEESELWNFKDSGVKAPQYTLNVFVSGSTYRAQRDRLLEELNKSTTIMKEGRAEKKYHRLVHPYYGSFDCHVHGNVRVSESADKGGIAYITFTVVRVEAPKVAKFSHTFAFLDATETALKGITEGFEEVFSVIDQTVEVVNRANTISQSITQIAQQLVQLSNLPRAVSSSLLGDIRDVQNTIGTLAYKPLNLALSLSGLYTSIAVAVVETPNMSSAYQQSTLNIMEIKVLEFPNKYPPAVAYDETSIAMNNNTQAQVNLVVGSLLLAINRIAVGMKTISKEHGASNKAKLLALSHTFAPGMDYKGFSTMDKNRSLALQCITETMDALPHTRTIQVDTPVPLGVLAHKLGTTRESLIELNKIPNPMFTKGLIKYLAAL